ncbi:MAG: caspase family protein [Proteobacteria bacterium]|nr:caspase family protein [Pseudomonadota bacterium]
MIRALIVIAMLVPTLASAQGRFGAQTDAPATSEGARKAILIGINDYQDESFSPLAYARNDAEGLGKVLADSAFGGFESVDLVVSGNLGAKQIVDALVTWSQTLAPEDEALIYFSAHGTRFIDERNRSRVFLAAADTRREDSVHTGIALDALQELLESLPAQRRILIIDACFTGDGKTSEADAEGAARAMIDAKLPFSDKVADKEARLFATTYGRPALESDTLGHGVYTAHLIEALSERFDEADINDDNVVSVSEAHDYARDRTMEGTGQLQVPMVFYKIVGKEDLLLSGDPNSRERVEMAMVSAYEGPQQGLRMFVDGEEKGVFPRTVLVKPGSRKVEFKNLEGKTIDSGRVMFRKEGVYNVTNIRDGLNGGRHLLSFGYAHQLMRGSLQETDGPIPAAPAFRFAYSFRFPSKVPLLRRLGVVVDFVAGGIPQQDTNVLGLSPPTAVLDLGVGPIIRFDLPYVLFSIQPRFGVTALMRNNVIQGSDWLNWLFGTIGSNFAVGFRPVNRFSVQFQYMIGGYNVGLQGGGEAKVELLHRFGGAVEVGF